jgi:hypothetical protein
MEQNRPTSGKGKAKEDGRESRPDHSGSSQTDKSLASRVISSASALAKDAVGSSDGHVPTALSSSSALGGKPQSSASSSGPSAWADTVSVRQGAPINRNDIGQQAGTVPESFRTQATTESARHAETDFDGFLSTMGDLQSGSREPSLWAHEFKGNDNFVKSFQAMNRSAGESSAENEQMKFDHVDRYDDGAEVRMLLSDPSFNAYIDTPDMMSTGEPTDATISDLFSQEFSPEEQSAAERIRSALPAPPVHKPVPPNHPINLRPRSDAEKEGLHQELHDLDSNIDGAQSQLSFSSEEQREHWVSEWDDVLNSYSDEVWGNMLPAVKAAKTQIEEVRGGATTVDTSAIARLKMILGHVSAGSSITHTASFNEGRHISEIEGKEDEAAPTFHCPWVSCDQVCLSIWQVEVVVLTMKLEIPQ